jgi:hypothetical protein
VAKQKNKSLKIPHSAHLRTRGIFLTGILKGKYKETFPPAVALSGYGVAKKNRHRN